MNSDKSERHNVISRSDLFFSTHTHEFIYFFGPIAQLRLERTPDKREVTGSTPVRPTVRKS